MPAPTFFSLISTSCAVILTHDPHYVTVIETILLKRR